MKQLFYALLLCLFLMPIGICANDNLPKQWSLRDCINYALEHNITIRKNRINVESVQEDVKLAKADLFPTLSGSIGQRIVNRPYSSSSTIINGDNISSIQSKTSYTGSYGIDASWTVYNGNKRRNNIKLQIMNSNMAELVVEESKLSIEEDITQLYVQILYSTEAVKVNEAILETSKKEYERAEVLFNVGSIASSDLAQLKANVSDYNYQLVSSQATLDNLKLELKQLLELEGNYDMDLYIPQIDSLRVYERLPSLDAVYLEALNNRPEIKSEKFNIASSDLNIKIARASYIPSLNFSAGIGTSNANGTDYTFSEQLKNNWDNSAGVTLSIPIYSRHQTKSAVNKAILQKQSSELDLADAQKALYRTIENLWLTANNAQKQYIAAAKKLESARESYALVNEQFNVGMKNTVELLTEKDNLLSAQQEALQAKYTFILNIGLLKFYKGEQIEI